MPHRIVAVFPSPEFEMRRRLFGAFEALYGLRFIGIEAEQLPAMEIAIIFASELPTVPPANGCEANWLVYLGNNIAPADKKSSVAFANVEQIDWRLRGRSMSESKIFQFQSIAALPTDVVMATRDLEVLWIRRRRNGLSVDLVGTGLEELGPNEVLRNQLKPGKFFPALVLTHFLRDAFGESIWTPPPPRAGYIIDDPNLHATTYGYIDFGELARHAKKHNYHIAMAMIPLDGWFTSRSAAQIFKEHSEWLSLLIHGNNHTKRELAQEISPDAIRAMLAQSLARIERFEKSSEISVSRVMVPPHGACYEPTMIEMRRLGFDGMTLNHRDQRTLGAAPQPVTRLWEPADLMAGGFPAVHRIELTEWRDDPRFREEVILYAFLGKPLILYGHHGDFISGFDLLAETAAQINSFGGVRWGSHSEIFSSNYLTRRKQGTFHVKLLSNHAKVRIDRGVERLVIEPGIGLDSALVPMLRWPHGAESLTQPVVIKLAENGSDREQVIEFRVTYRDKSDLSNVALGFNPRARLRRILAEGRDRLQPLVRWD
jgi:hypothetical protein